MLYDTAAGTAEIHALVAGIPTTTISYSRDTGMVTLAAAAAMDVPRSVVDANTKQIEEWTAFIWKYLEPPVEPGHIFHIEWESTDTKRVLRYRENGGPWLTRCEAHPVTQVVSFQARTAQTISWGQFVRWINALRTYVHWLSHGEFPI